MTWTSAFVTALLLKYGILTWSLIIVLNRVHGYLSLQMIITVCQGTKCSVNDRALQLYWMT